MTIALGIIVALLQAWVAYRLNVQARAFQEIAAAVARTDARYQTLQDDISSALVVYQAEAVRLADLRKGIIDAIQANAAHDHDLGI